MELINKKAKNSDQFAQVAAFIAVIADTETGEIVKPEYHWLCRCPWTDAKLSNTINNLSTTHFIALFPSMKSTSCERNLRRYKELHGKFLTSK
jgi:hypothetical protein